MFNLSMKTKKLLIELIHKELTKDEQKDLYQIFDSDNVLTLNNYEKSINWEKFFNYTLKECKYNDFFKELVKFLYKYNDNEACEKINEAVSHSNCKYRIYYNNQKRISKSGSFCEVFIINEDNNPMVIKKLENRTNRAINIFNREKIVISKLRKLENNINKKMILYVDTLNGYEIKMEMAEYSLLDAIDNKLSISNDQIIDMLDKIKFLHDSGIVHRDLHPGNFVFKNNSWYIIDFGISAIDTDHSTISLENNAGVKEYTDPLVFYGGLNNANKQTDIYSVGKIINIIKTGNPNNYAHEFRSISEKCTINDLKQRYKQIGSIINDIKILI